MKKIKFQCRNCGNREERNILPLKHTVQGTNSILGREISCCKKPNYRDLKGLISGKNSKSVKEFVPLIA